VLVVQEISGKFGGTGVWKMPTGVVDEVYHIYQIEYGSNYGTSKIISF
jgi:hypothetical protein